MRRLIFVLSVACLLPVAGYAKDWELVRTQGKMQLVVVAKSREADFAVYQDAIKGVCVSGQFCMVHFWSNRKDIPMKWPMTEAEATAQAASYTKNPNTGFEEFLWNCRIKNDPKKCFSD